MKTIRSESIISLTAKYEETKAMQKTLEESLKTMRESLLAAMGDEATAKAGEYLLLRSERTRTDLDKKALLQALGADLAQYEKKSSYEILEVKKA